MASGVWAHVEANTQVWLRVFSEERGMSASGHFSLLAALLLITLVGAPPAAAAALRISTS